MPRLLNATVGEGRTAPRQHLSATELTGGVIGRSQEMVLRMEGISKAFPGVQALQNVDFEAAAGEVVALVGENGAGKSTLMKILSGVYRRDAGRIFLHGQEVEISEPAPRPTVGHRYYLPRIQPDPESERCGQHLCLPRAAPARPGPIPQLCGSPAHGAGSAAAPGARRRPRAGHGSDPRPVGRPAADGRSRQGAGRGRPYHHHG